MTSVRRVEHRSPPLASTEMMDPISIFTALGADLAAVAAVAASAEDTALASAVAARAISAVVAALAVTQLQSACDACPVMLALACAVGRIQAHLRPSSSVPCDMGAQLVEPRSIPEDLQPHGPQTHSMARCRRGSGKACVGRLQLSAPQLVDPDHEGLQTTCVSGQT